MADPFVVPKEIRDWVRQEIEAVRKRFETLYPVGSIYISVDATNPAQLLGFGRWTAFGAGRTLVGLNAGDADFDTAEETGGAKTHTLTAAQLPAKNISVQHRDVYPLGGGSTAISDVANTSGGGGDSVDVNTTGGSNNSHNNLQPYIVVRMWKRIG